MLVLLLLSLSFGQLSFGRSSRAQVDMGRLPGAPPERAGKKVSRELLDLAHSSRGRNSRVRVVLQLDDGATGALDSLLPSFGARTLRVLQHLNARVVELPVGLVEALSAHGDVAFISPDRESVPLGHVSSTSGADMVRNVNGTN